MGFTEDEWEEVRETPRGQEILASDPLWVPAVDRSQGIEQGLLAVVLAVIVFILKKFILAYTDFFPLEVGAKTQWLWAASFGHLPAGVWYIWLEHGVLLALAPCKS